MTDRRAGFMPTPLDDPHERFELFDVSEPWDLHPVVTASQRMGPMPASDADLRTREALVSLGVVRPQDPMGEDVPEGHHDDDDEFDAAALSESRYFGAQANRY